MPPNETTIDIRDLIWKVRQYRYLIILPIVVMLSGALVYYRLSTPLYESATIVSVGERAQVSPMLEPLVRADREANASPALLDGRIHSRSFLQSLVERLGILRSPDLQELSRESTDRPQGISADEYILRVAITRLGRKISVIPGSGSLCRIVARDPNPVQAKVLAAAVADLLVEQSRESSLEMAQARGSFSADQISIYEERLRKSEDALRTFQESLIGRNLQASLINDGNLDIARNLIRLNNEEMDQIRSRLTIERRTWLDEAASGAVAPDLSSSAAANMDTRLEELEVSYGIASLGGEKAGGDVTLLKGRIADLRRGLLTEYESLAAALPGPFSDRSRSAISGIALDRSILRSLRSKGQRLTAQVASFAQGVRSSPRDQMEMERLRSEVDRNRTLVANLQKEATSSRLSEALQTSELGVRLDIVETAQIPLYPVSPNPLRIFGGAIFLGPLLGLGLIISIEKLGGVIRTVEQAEQEIGARVIGTVPRVEGWSRPGSFFSNHWAALSILLVLLLTGIFYTVRSALQPAHRSSRPAAVERR